jgi:hypothetical protein
MFFISSLLDNDKRDIVKYSSILIDEMNMYIEWILIKYLKMLIDGKFYKNFGKRKKKEQRKRERRKIKK